jgi:hypothetical protein
LNDEITNIEQMKNPQNAFLYTSLNLEFVCAILQGIKISMKESQREKIESLSLEENIRKTDYKKYINIDLKGIEVLN